MECHFVEFKMIIKSFALSRFIVPLVTYRDNRYLILFCRVIKIRLLYIDIKIGNEKTLKISVVPRLFSSSSYITSLCHSGVVMTSQAT